MDRPGFLLAAGAVAALPQLGVAQVVTPLDAVARLFTAPHLNAAWFQPVLLAQIPLERIAAIVHEIIATLGPYRAVVPNGKSSTVTFERGTIQADAALDSEGRLSLLFFSRMQSEAVAARLTDVFRADSVQASWFDAHFLKEVPIETMRSIISALRQQNGAFVRLAAASDGTYTLTFERASASAFAFLDPEGKLAGLIVRPAGS